MESIFIAKTWELGRARYAVYVAEDKMDYVQAVCRDLEPAPEPPAITVKESVSTNNDTQPAQTVGVDPKMVMDGGENSWDEQRQVAAQAMGNMGF